MIGRFLSIGLGVLIMLMTTTIFYQKKRNLSLKEDIKISARKISYLNTILNANWNSNSNNLLGELKGSNLKNPISWVELNSKNGVLVYRQPVLGCTTCFEEKISFFLKSADTLKLPNILVTNDTEQRNLANFKRLSKYHGNIYFSRLVIPELDLSSITYIFLFENNQVKSIHIPDVEFPEYTQKYLETVSEQFKKKNVNVSLQ